MMYRSSCSCQEIQLEVSASSEQAPDIETLSCNDGQSLVLCTHRRHITIDCAPNALGEIHLTPNQTQVFCNFCSTQLFTQNQAGDVELTVKFYGHDLLNEHHGQFNLP